MKRYLVFLSVFYHGGNGHERPMYYCVFARTPQAAGNKVVKMAKKELYRTSVTLIKVKEISEDDAQELRSQVADKKNTIQDIKTRIEIAQRELERESKLLYELERQLRAIN